MENNNKKQQIINNTQIIHNFILEHKLNPPYIYENLHLNEITELIKKELKDLSGVYLIYNKITNDYYIGSASNNKFYVKLRNHLYNLNGSKILKYVIKKYKLKNLAFIILELFPLKVDKYTNKQLIDLEDYYLKTLLPNYNILTEAGLNYGYKHTEITRLKIKLNFSNDRKILIGNLNNKSEKLILYNLDYTVYGEYPSIKEAAISLRISDNAIRRALLTPKKLLKRRWIVNIL